MNLRVSTLKENDAHSICDIHTINRETFQSFFPSLLEIVTKKEKNRVLRDEDKLHKIEVDSLYTITHIDKDKKCITIQNSQTCDTHQVDFFSKVTPILDPIHVIREFYGRTHGVSAKTDDLIFPPQNPTHIRRLVSKLYSKETAAYCETVCAILLSHLVEQNQTTHFPLTLLTCTGKLSNYEYPCPGHEYMDLLDSREFVEGLLNGLAQGYVNVCVEENDTSSTPIKPGFHNQSMRKRSPARYTEKCEDVHEDTAEDTRVDKSIVHDSNNMAYVEMVDQNHVDEDLTYTLSIKNHPCMIIVMEKFNETLDDWFQRRLKRIMPVCFKPKTHLERAFTTWKTITRWMTLLEHFESLILQIIAALEIAQKTLDFTHNDLHMGNVMLETKYNTCSLTYTLGDHEDCYKIPVYNDHVVKIIDFGRSIFTYKKKQFFSDVFRRNGDAGGQYTHSSQKRTTRSKHVRPNPSFDLARLSSAVQEYIDTPILKMLVERSQLFKRINSWCVTDAGEDIAHVEGFELYQRIAAEIHTATPKMQLDMFHKFKSHRQSLHPN